MNHDKFSQPIYTVYEITSTFSNNLLVYISLENGREYAGNNRKRNNQVEEIMRVVQMAENLRRMYIGLIIAVVLTIIIKIAL